MSWSFHAVGVPAAVAAAAIKQKTDGHQCVRPEEGFRQSALDLIAAAVSVYPEGKAVQVEASGHQDCGDAEQASNALNIKITPLYGFLS